MPNKRSLVQVWSPPDFAELLAEFAAHDPVDVTVVEL
jgi:hypothetical protein